MSHEIYVDIYLKLLNLSFFLVITIYNFGERYATGKNNHHQYTCFVLYNVITDYENTRIFARGFQG